MPPDRFMSIRLQFEYRSSHGGGPLLDEFSYVCNNVLKLVANCSFVGHGSYGGKDHFSSFERGLEVRQLTFASPLAMDLKSHLGKMPALKLSAIKKALDTVLDFLLFRNQRLKRLEAETAEKWEDVYRKRLENAERAFKFLKKAGLEPDEWNLEQLMEAIRALEGQASHDSFFLVEASVAIEDVPDSTSSTDEKRRTA